MARRVQGHEDKIKEIRELAEKDLRVFAKIVTYRQSKLSDNYANTQHGQTNAA